MAHFTPHSSGRAVVQPRVDNFRSHPHGHPSSTWRHSSVTQDIKGAASRLLFATQSAQRPNSPPQPASVPSAPLVARRSMRPASAPARRTHTRRGAVTGPSAAVTLVTPTHVSAAWAVGVPSPAQSAFAHTAPIPTVAHTQRRPSAASSPQQQQQQQRHPVQRSSTGVRMRASHTAATRKPRLRRVQPAAVAASSGVEEGSAPSQPPPSTPAPVVFSDDLAALKTAQLVDLLTASLSLHAEQQGTRAGRTHMGLPDSTPPPHSPAGLPAASMYDAPPPLADESAPPLRDSSGGSSQATQLQLSSMHSSTCETPPDLGVGVPLTTPSDGGVGGVGLHTLPGSGVQVQVLARYSLHDVCEIAEAHRSGLNSNFNTDRKRWNTAFQAVQTSLHLHRLRTQAAEEATQRLRDALDAARDECSSTSVSLGSTQGALAQALADAAQWKHKCHTEAGKHRETHLRLSERMGELQAERDSRAAMEQSLQAQEYTRAGLARDLAAARSSAQADAQHAAQLERRVAAAGKRLPLLQQALVASKRQATELQVQLQRAVDRGAAANSENDKLKRRLSHKSMRPSPRGAEASPLRPTSGGRASPVPRPSSASSTKTPPGPPPRRPSSASSAGSADIKPASPVQGISLGGLSVQTAPPSDLEAPLPAADSPPPSTEAPLAADVGRTGTDVAGEAAAILAEMGLGGDEDDDEGGSDDDDDVDAAFGGRGGDGTSLSPVSRMNRRVNVLLGGGQIRQGGPLGGFSPSSHATSSLPAGSEGDTYTTALRQRVQAQQSSLEHTRDQMMELREKMIAAQNTSREAQAAASATSSKAAAEVLTAQNRSREAATARTNAEAQLKGREAELGRLRAQVADLSEYKLHAEDTFARRAEALRGAAEEAQGGARALAAQLAEANKALSRAREDRNTAQQQEHAAEAARAAAEETAATSADQALQLQRRLGDTSSQLLSAQGSISLMSRQLKELAGEVATDSQAQRVEKRWQGLMAGEEAQHEATRTRLRDAEHRVAELNSDTDKLRREVGKWNAEAARLKGELSKLQEKVIKLEDEVERTQSTTEAIEGALHGEKRRVAELADSLREAQRAKQLAETQLTASDKKVQGLLHWQRNAHDTMRTFRNNVLDVTGNRVAGLVRAVKRLDSKLRMAQTALRHFRIPPTHAAAAALSFPQGVLIQEHVLSAGNHAMDGSGLPFTGTGSALLPVSPLPAGVSRGAHSRLKQGDIMSATVRSGGSTRFAGTSPAGAFASPGPSVEQTMSRGVSPDSIPLGSVRGSPMSHFLSPPSPSRRGGGATPPTAAAAAAAPSTIARTLDWGPLGGRAGDTGGGQFDPPLPVSSGGVRGAYLQYAAGNRSLQGGGLSPDSRGAGESIPASPLTAPSANDTRFRADVQSDAPLEGLVALGHPVSHSDVQRWAEVAAHAGEDAAERRSGDSLRSHVATKRTSQIVARETHEQFGYVWLSLMDFALAHSAGGDSAAGGGRQVPVQGGASGAHATPDQVAAAHPRVQNALHELSRLLGVARGDIAQVTAVAASTVQLLHVGMPSVAGEGGGGRGGMHPVDGVAGGVSGGGSAAAAGAPSGAAAGDAALAAELAAATTRSSPLRRSQARGVVQG